MDTDWSNAIAPCWTSEEVNKRLIADAVCNATRRLPTVELRFAIYARDGYQCQHCGFMASSKRTKRKLTIDHIYPFSKGGRTVPWNLQTLCAACNCAKADRIETASGLRVQDGCAV